MANNFQVVLTAVDQTNGPINKAKNSLQQLAKQASTVTYRHTDRLTQVVESFSAGNGAVSGFLRGTLGVVGGVAAAVFALSKLEAAWAAQSRAMTNLGTRTGLATPEAYKVQYAGRLAGLTPEQANGGIEQLRQTYSDALNNRNPEALKRYQAAGISTDPTHMDSVETVLTKLSAYAQTLRDQGKYGGSSNYLNAAGAGQLIDFLNRGPSRVASDLQNAASYVPSPLDIQRANQYADATAKLGITYDNLRNTILSDFEPALNAVLRSVQFLFDTVEGRKTPDTQQVHEGFEKFGNQLRGNGAVTNEQLQQNGPDPAARHPIEAFGNFLRGNGARSNAEVAAEPNANVPRAVEYFTQHGSTRMEAIAKTANLLRESKLDPVAEGDNGQAFGVAQWHADRQKDFEKWSGHTIRTSTLEEQLGFMDHELRAGNYQSANASLKSAGSVEDAAAVLSRQYERPKAADAEARTRAGIASQLAALYPVPMIYNPASAPRVAESQPVPESPYAQPKVQPDVDSGPVGRGERQQPTRIEIVHRNPPPGTNVNVTSPRDVDVSMTTDRQSMSLGEQYAYRPGAF
ncbi:MAG: phage tail tip lysozyme [Pseudomonadota bacterium]|nr:phage tail tip lysozyme [Pseudomonadota bacterium]